MVLGHAEFLWIKAIHDFLLDQADTLQAAGIMSFLDPWLRWDPWLFFVVETYIPWKSKTIIE